MIPYASRTGTRRNLAALRAAGWRLMVSARGVLRHEGFPYALDNGAWTAFQEYQAGKRPTPEPDLPAFARALDKLGAGADFIVVPDIVMGGDQSWQLSLEWLDQLQCDNRLEGARLMLAVQNGFDPAQVAPYLSDRVGVFIGGDTEWKLSSAPSWVRVAHDRGALCHMGRVNTAKRATYCDRIGVDSIDGSGPSRFEDCLRRVDAAFVQRDLCGLAERLSR